MSSNIAAYNAMARYGTPRRHWPQIYHNWAWKNRAYVGHGGKVPVNLQGGYYHKYSNNKSRHYWDGIARLHNSKKWTKIHKKWKSRALGLKRRKANFTMTRFFMGQGIEKKLKPKTTLVDRAKHEELVKLNKNIQNLPFGLKYQIMKYT